MVGPWQGAIAPLHAAFVMALGVVAPGPPRPTGGPSPARGADGLLQLCGEEPPPILDWVQKFLTGRSFGDEVRRCRHAASPETSNGTDIQQLVGRWCGWAQWPTSLAHWIGQATLGVHGWFSSTHAKGAMATDGGWLLYLVDLSGYAFFGNYWPLVGTAAVVGLAFLLCVIMGYIARTLQGPLLVVRRMAALFPWPQGRGERAPASAGSAGPTRVRWMGPDVDRLPETVFYQEVMRGRGQQRKPNDALLRIGGQVARLPGREDASLRIVRRR